MLRHLVLLTFLALWVSFVIAEAPVATTPASPQNTAPLSDAAKESSDKFERFKVVPPVWSSYGRGWGRHGHYGRVWGRGRYRGRWGRRGIKECPWG